MATVTADVTENVRNARELRAAITRAVTEWHGSDCPEARRAWEYCGDDFNIGDLAQYAEPGFVFTTYCKLSAILEKHGVKGLQIDVDDVDSDSGGWTFDTRLTEYQPENE